MILALLLPGFGCAAKRMAELKTVSNDPFVKQFRFFSEETNKFSEQTRLTLRAYDLEKKAAKEPISTLLEIQNASPLEKTAELNFSFAEIAYFEAKKQEKENPKLATEIYYAALLHACQYLFDPKYEDERNPYDSRFRDICVIYNNSLQCLLKLLGNEYDLLLTPGNTYTIHSLGENCNVYCSMRTGDWKGDEIEKFKFAHDYAIKGLQNEYRQHGLGVPLIAIRKTDYSDSPLEKYYPDGLCFPVTAVLRPVLYDGNSKEKPSLHAVLELYDPLVSGHVEIGRNKVPLESDSTTPLAYFLSNPLLDNINTMGMFRPDEVLRSRFIPHPNEELILAEKIRRKHEMVKAKSLSKYGDDATASEVGPSEAKDTVWGVYMVQPYDPKKIPVVMVHGLWSSPMTWIEMFNALRDVPEIREKYQFWFYFYPSAQPFWVSAAQLRDDLAELRRRLAPEGNSPALEEMILIGHSMGGLIARMQTMRSEDEVWKLVSNIPFEQLPESAATKEQLKKWFFFSPNPSVSEVITIATPFRGSDFSNNLTQWFTNKLIQLPKTLTGVVKDITTQDNRNLSSDSLLKMKTSVQSLSPKNPIFPLMVSQGHPSDVHYHNIIGIQETSRIMKYFNSQGDGVVKLASAKIEDAESEITVPASHVAVHMHPRAVREVRRILLENLQIAKNEPEPSKPADPREPLNMPTPLDPPKLRTTGNPEAKQRRIALDGNAESPRPIFR